MTADSTLEADRRVENAPLGELVAVGVDDVEAQMDHLLQPAIDSASLYRCWERQQWTISNLDFTRDASDWQTLPPPRVQCDEAHDDALLHHRRASGRRGHRARAPTGATEPCALHRWGLESTPAIPSSSPETSLTPGRPSRAPGAWGSWHGGHPMPIGSFAPICQTPPRAYAEPADLSGELPCKGRRPHPTPTPLAATPWELGTDAFWNHEPALAVMWSSGLK
jgi:hypothetical protein